MESKNLTTNEREVLKSLVVNAKKAGDSGVEFILEDVARETGKTTRKISGTVGSLAKKGMIVCFGEDSYFDGKVTEAGFKEVDDSKKEAKTSSTKKEIDKDNKEEQPKEKEAKTARKVGDRHPKHSNWIWKEYKPGKFDWRISEIEK